MLDDLLAATPSAGRLEGRGFGATVVPNAIFSLADRSVRFKDRPGVYTMWNMNREMWEDLRGGWLGDLEMLPRMYVSLPLKQTNMCRN